MVSYCSIFDFKIR